MSLLRRWRQVVLGWSVAWVSSTCLAQGVPPVRLPQDSPREPQPVTSAMPLAIDRERHAEQLPPGAQTTKFVLAGVDLVGNRKLPTSSFEPLWADLVGKEIPLARVFDIAGRISAIYREAGYVLSQALVPQQEIVQAGSRVKIRVAEGFVSRITVADGVAGTDRILATLAPIQNERPLTLATLERHLLLLNDLPGVRARASLRAGREENAAELELLVDRDLDAYSLSAHNRTSAAVGPMRLEASAERRAVFGDFDRHVLRWVGSGNQRLNLLAYSGDAPIGHDGAQLSWSASASRSKPKSGELFQLDTDSESLSLGIGYPVLRSRSTNLGVRATLAGYNGSSDIADGLPLSEERLRSVRLGLSFDRTDGLGGVNLIDIEFARGLSGLGASEAGDVLLSREGTNPQFSKTTLYLARLQSLGGEWSLLAAGTAQSSSDILASSEQFGLGGEVFLRAYDPSELLGDQGAAAKLELRYNQTFASVASTWYAFYEGGTVRSRNADGSQLRQSARSAGVGLRLSASRGLKAFVEVAKPGKKPTARNGDEKPRAFAGIGLDL